MGIDVQATTPGKEVAKGVSLVTFGGILNGIMSLVAVVGAGSLTCGAYPWVSFGVGVVLVVCGRSLRRLWVPMLYVTAAVLVGSTAYYAYSLTEALRPGALIQVPLGVWLVWAVYRTAGPMKQLHATGGRAYGANPYRELFLRRFSG